MWKRIVIGAFAGIVLVAAVALLSRPKPGTIAYHKEKYLDAHRQITGTESAAEWMKSLCRSMLGRPSRWHDKYETAKSLQNRHRAALVRLNYLEQRTFVIQQCQRFDVEQELHWAAQNSMDENRNLPFVEITSQAANEITVICLSGDMAKFAEWVAQADVARKAAP